MSSVGGNIEVWKLYLKIGYYVFSLRQTPGPDIYFKLEMVGLASC